MKKEPDPSANVLQYAIETLDWDLEQRIPKRSREWYVYLKLCAVKSTDLLEKQKQKTYELQAELKDQKDFIEWMHLGQFFQLYRILRRQIPFFDPNAEMPEAISRIAEDWEREWAQKGS